VAPLTLHIFGNCLSMMTTGEKNVHEGTNKREVPHMSIDARVIWVKVDKGL